MSVTCQIRIIATEIFSLMRFSYNGTLKQNDKFKLNTNTSAK